MDFIEQFRTEMAQHTIIYKETIIADGTLHRIHVEGDSKDDLNGWYVLFDSTVPGGAFGCWKRGIKQNWCSKSRNELSSTEWDAHIQMVEQAKKEAEAKRRIAQEAAKKVAQTIWSSAKPADSNHPYIQKKRVIPGTLRQDYEGNLLVPIYGINKEIQSIQKIPEIGKKNFLTDGAIKGGFTPIGRSTDPMNKFYIGEGWATCMTINMVTGKPVACALCSWNLVEIAELMHNKYPEAEIIIVADNDQWPDKNGKINNVGARKANEAAEKIGASIVSPNFKGFDISSKPTDFNDLFTLAGEEEVRRQLEVNIFTPNQTTEEILHPIKPRIAEVAFFGILNEFVEVSKQNSEASPVAVAANVIAFFSTLVGRKVSQWIGDAEIHCRPFFLLIGSSGKARKGTSERLPRRVFARVDELLSQTDQNHSKLQIHEGGLSSTEGIVYHIRDASDDQKNQDLGVQDKRLLVIEAEFANLLALCKRDSSTLSATIRKLFDGKPLAPLTKRDRISVAEPHVVITGHITQYELNNKSGALEASNGLLNRFLICHVERPCYVPLPDKTSDETIQRLASELTEILKYIDSNQNLIEITLTPEAAELWIALYPDLTRERPGFIGALMARSEVYTRMLAMIFCLLDKKTCIGVAHLQAALAWISFVEESIEYIFGNTRENKVQSEIEDIANQIEIFIRNKGSMNKTDINKALHGHVPKEKINEALSLLLNTSPPVIQHRMEKTGGKPKEIFEIYIAEKAEKAE